MLNKENLLYDEMIETFKKKEKALQEALPKFPWTDSILEFISDLIKCIEFQNTEINAIIELVEQLQLVPEGWDQMEKGGS